MSDVIETRPIVVSQTQAQPKLVRVPGFGVGEKPTALISIITAIGCLALWWLVARLGLVSHLFLPRPDEVLTQIGVVYRDGYAGASLSEHVLASLFRIVIAAAIAIGVGIVIATIVGATESIPWRWSIGIAAVPAAIMFGLLLRLPKAPDG